MAPVMTEMRTAVIGALVVTLGSISTALYTPALPQLVTAFQTVPSAIKLTMTVYLFGFAFAMLICGPVSDAFGRRPAAALFLAIYVAGSVVALLAPSIELLIIARLCQGIGAASGVTVSRAMVRDQFTGNSAMKIMNLIGLILAIGPAVSPTIGGLILGLFGWHAIFAIMAAYGATAFLVVILACPETNLSPEKSKIYPLSMLKNYAILLSNKRFMHNSLLLGLTVGGVYTLAVILPFVFIEVLGVTPMQFGMAMVIQTGSYAFGTLATNQILLIAQGKTLINIGLTCVATGGVLMLVIPELFPLNLWSVMVPVGIWAFGCAFIIPAATTAALAGFGTIAGAAAALTGFMQIGGGLLGSGLTALLFDSATFALRFVLPAMALLALLAHWCLSERVEVL
jgi:MFS transporter, DHA1 family, multidrug resistance protein